MDGPSSQSTDQPTNNRSTQHPNSSAPLSPRRGSRSILSNWCLRPRAGQSGVNHPSRNKAPMNPSSNAPCVARRSTTPSTAGRRVVPHDDDACRLRDLPNDPRQPSTAELDLDTAQCGIFERPPARPIVIRGTYRMHRPRFERWGGLLASGATQQEGDAYPERRQGVQTRAGLDVGFAHRAMDDFRLPRFLAHLDWSLDDHIVRGSVGSIGGHKPSGPFERGMKSRSLDHHHAYYHHPCVPHTPPSAQADRRSQPRSQHARMGPWGSSGGPLDPSCIVPARGALTRGVSEHSLPWEGSSDTHHGPGALSERAVHHTPAG